MRSGVNTQVWVGGFTTADLPVIETAATAGYAAIELGFSEAPASFDVDAVRAALQARGLEPALCGFLAPERDISSADPASHEAGRAYLVSACRTVRELGGSIVCGPLYAELFRARDLPAAERQAEWERSVTTMREVAAEAEELGAVLAIEPLNRFETDMVNTVEQALAYVDAVGSSAVRVHLDTFHMNVEERNLPDAIRAAGNQLAHFHACENDRGVPGTGHVDWSGVRSALDDIAYEGLVVFEGFNPEVVDLANGARIWRDLGGQPDVMAASAARFLSDWI